MRTTILVTLLLAAPLTSAGAQHWKGAAETTRLNWGTVYVLVGADTTRGVEVRAMTSRTNYDGLSRSYFGGFDPALVEPWLAEANAVVTYSGAPTSDSARALETPALGASDGSGLILRRARHKNKWDSDVALIFAPSIGKGWAISARHDEALAFLQALQLEEVRSRLVPVAADTSSGLIDCFNLDEPPARLSGPDLVWPNFGGEPTRSTEVLLEYVIGADGRAEPNSFVAIWFEDPHFVDAAVKAVTGSKFRPGMVHGQPVRTLVRQPVIFSTE